MLDALTNNASAPTGRYSKHFVVSGERESLADYLRRVISEKNLKYRQVALRSGGRISHASISAIIKGQTKDIKSSTISALAKGLDVPEADLFAIVRGKPLSSEEQANEEKERIWAMYTDIPRQCQKDVMDLLEVLQRNHSISARREQRDKRRIAASGHGREISNGPVRVATPLYQEGWENERRDMGEEPITLPPKKQTRQAS